VPYWRQGPEGTATPSTGPDTAPAFCVRTSSRGMRACAGIAVARPETTSLSMSCGTRAPHVRPGDPDGARPLRSSLNEQLPCQTGYFELQVLPTATAQRPGTAPLSGSQPRRPSCICSGLEPHCRTSRRARPQPTPSPRYRSLTSLLDTATALALAYLHLRVLHLRYCGPATAAPDHCGPPGPVVSPVAVLRKPWLRNSTTAPSCTLRLHVLLPGSSCLPGPAISLATRETITTPPP
jgi:hypothetical protein